MSFHTIAIETRKKLQHPQQLTQLIKFLHNLDATVLLSPTTQQHLPDSALGPYNYKTSVDLIIVFGGDGTILHTVQQLKGKPVPILGVNFGHLGFLTSLEGDNFIDSIETILQGEYTQHKRIALNITIKNRKGNTTSLTAINECYIFSGQSSRLIHLPTSIDNQELTTFSGDGLLIATPTGSTAYNLSAGGPIVSPTVSAIILTPVNTHSFSQKPIVIDSDCNVTVTIPEHTRDPLALTVDGRTPITLNPNDTITITQSPNPITLLGPKGRNFFGTITTKLGRGG